MINKNIIITTILTAVLLASCVRNSNNPGREFIPDMAHSKAYEGYWSNPGNPTLPSDANAQLPPKGAIAQSFDVYPYPNTNEGYAEAGAQVFNPYQFSAEEIEGEGKVLFERFCAICHGTGGEGNGHLVEIEKFPAPPSYFSDVLLALPEGQRYHSVMYGKGMMGSYATQLSHKQRWLTLAYVEKMQKDYLDKKLAEEGNE